MVVSVVFLCVSLSHDAEPKYKGLRNRGSTDYLNSVLQVLFMTKEFRGAVQSESSHTSYIDAHLKDLFRQLKTGSPTTEYIICKLGIENVWKQHDAAEYFEKMLSLASPEASQVFHGRLIHRTSCSCGVSTDDHNSFWTLNLPISNAHNGVYNVEDGLKRFFSQSKLTGDNQVYCDECEVKRDTITECEVGLYPKVLVLLLKRFEFSYYEMDYVKNDCPVDVPLDIDIPKGVSYELYATVDHVGDLRGGHYTATIQPPDDRGCWYDFNDSRVTPKINFNPERSQNGYLFFYRKRERQMSDSPQEHHHGSSVDQDESDTNQNNTDDGYAYHDNEDLFHTPPSPSGPLDEQPVWAGRGDVTRGDEVTEGVDVTECGEVTGGDEVTEGVDVTECGEVTGGDEVTEGVDVPERGEVTGGDVVAGDPQTLESARLDGKGGERIKRDEELPTNEKESREPGDQAVQQEASGTGPIVSGPEGGVNERRRGLRESMGLLEVREEGDTEGDVIQKKHRKVFDIPNSLSLSGMCLSSRPRFAKRKPRLGNKVDMVEDKKSIKKRRKKNSFDCYNKQTSDTE
ncbi:ubiquitin carboxyl-terminal hydrolase 48-like [Gadus morhua]|uniref:ubiquitin carboxyl-terminal hydrolase 48-like n=1 Tax=Gadus morhua TaxID=8049 RepID=UPI0011B76129|nr:ubiquitin carboxyl-terminal hydrolase 48-like [Gadus morhua]XP_030205811.1 ubiquitin carboxyl-terminal hydrolase 48-like [Gadus morhua]